MIFDHYHDFEADNPYPDLPRRGKRPKRICWGCLVGIFMMLATLLIVRWQG